MAYEMTGKVKMIADAQTFASGFAKREMVLTVADGKYPQDISLEFLQDKVSLLASLQEGQEITVSFDIRGRAYNDRYFNNLVGWKIDGIAPSHEAPSSAPSSAPEVPVDDFEDDIPF